jgi:predicted outer membrane protein
MNKRIVMQALAGVFALGVGTALAGPETTKPADPAQPMRPSAGTTAPTPTPVPPPPSPTGTTGSPHGTMGTPPATGTTTATSAPAGGTLTPSEQKQAKKVLNDIHNVNALEITLGRLAQQKAESQAIKDYAQMLVTDHESADKKVMDFANANSIMLSANVSGTGQPSTATDAGTRAGMGPAATGAQGATGTARTTAGTNPAAGTGNSPATAGAVPPTTDVPPLELAPADRSKVAKLEKLEGTKFEKAFLTEMVKGHQKTLGKLKGAEKSAKNAELKALLGDISTSVQMHLDKAKELQRAGSASL